MSNALRTDPTASSTRPPSRPVGTNLRPDQQSGRHGEAPRATLPDEQTASPRDRPTIDLIRERAHRLWEEAGRPAGDGREFWERAEAEIDGMNGVWTGDRKR